MNRVTTIPTQGIYVIECGEGFSCFGFANARDHANQIAARLSRTELAFTDTDYGVPAGYQKYLQAVEAWSNSPWGSSTYFAPGTDIAATRVLEECRHDRRKVRLICGDRQTGESWLDEHDVIGRIARSCGALRVPLLVESGSGGAAIATACLLAIVQWETGRFLYRHPAYRIPDLSIRASEIPNRPWEVLRGPDVVASFRDIGQAGGYVAFMCGATVEPRIFQS